MGQNCKGLRAKSEGQETDRPVRSRFCNELSWAVLLNVTEVRMEEAYEPVPSAV